MTAAAGVPLASRPLDAAVGECVASYFRRHPVTASFAGMHDHDHRLPDWSPDGLSASGDERRSTRRALAAAGAGALSGPELVRRDWAAIDGALAVAWLDIEDAEDASAHYVRGNPSLAVGEALFGLVALAWDEHRPAAERAEAAIERAAAIPGFLEGVRLTMGGHPVPSLWKARSLAECAAGRDLLADLAAGWLPPGRAARSLEEALGRAADALVPFAAWVAGCPDAPSPAHAAGEALLGVMLRRGHWCETAPAELRREAREAMAVEEDRLQAMLRDAGGVGWPEVAERLAADRVTRGAVLDACRGTWEAAREAAAGQVTWPGIPVHYEPMPAWARRAAGRLYYLMYRSPAPMRYPPFDRYAVPVPAPDESPEAHEAFERTWNRSAITLNHVAHHGGLGHHVQNWHAARSPSRVGRVAAVDGASRIASILGGSMAEGWACYATGVLEGLGFLTPDERLSEQHTRLRLAVRAVVDLELHSGRLPIDEAMRLHERVAGQAPAAARNEVTKCSMFPGTASMYWIGTRELWRLRREQERLPGARFDVRAFHDELLACGSVPVPLVARFVAASRPA